MKYLVALLLFLASGLATAANVSVSLTINKTELDAPGPVVLTWTSSGAGVCNAADGWTGVKNLNGTETVQVSKTTKFTLTCQSATGPATLSWTAPTMWADGTPLTVTGYQVFMGGDPANLARGPLLPPTPTQNVVIQALAGKQYFALRSQGTLNGISLESADSTVATKTVVADSGSAATNVTLTIRPMPPTNLTVQ